MTAFGIDVSHWQGDVSDLARHLDFVIVKVSQAFYPDASGPEHMAQAARAGAIVGAYHWLDPEPTARTQAAVFLQHAGDAAFLAVDCEGRLLANMPNAEQMARDFIAAVHALDPKHRKVLLYSSRGTWPWRRSHGEDGRWVADYSGDPNRALLRLTGRGVPWTFWQNSDGAGRLDHDVFAGTRAELMAWIGHGEPTPVPHPTPTPAPGGHLVKFIQLSSADLAGLPSIEVPKDTPIEDFAGEQWDTIGPTNVRVLPGLVDAHSNRRAVVISTGRFYDDHIARPTAQVAVLGGK